ncbi:MAG: hypothetical protein JJ920_06050 [Roseitalea sp.]|jgi:hypothetical protein|nr:hypothetical protein [Roseitalea sp.]MBO6723110.1 hypothetical protein [Roseitalea sp.]MBO6742452.1 hypothetical protein [Roseitalea sp.]
MPTTIVQILIATALLFFVNHLDALQAQSLAVHASLCSQTAQAEANGPAMDWYIGVLASRLS